MYALPKNRNLKGCKSFNIFKNFNLLDFQLYFDFNSRISFVETCIHKIVLFYWFFVDNMLNISDLFINPHSFI